MEILAVIVLAAGAVAIVAYPFLRSAAGSGGADGPPLPHFDEAALSAEVERYRAALRAGTGCRRCHFANPPGSRYCAECGRRLDSSRSWAEEVEDGGVGWPEGRAAASPPLHPVHEMRGEESEDGRGTPRAGSHA